MAVRITIHTGNAAFEEDQAGEVARILRVLENRIRGNGNSLANHLPRPLIDINGNTVGKVEIVK